MIKNISYSFKKGQYSPGEFIQGRLFHKDSNGVPLWKSRPGVIVEELSKDFVLVQFGTGKKQSNKKRIKRSTLLNNTYVFTYDKFYLVIAHKSQIYRSRAKPGKSRFG